MNDLQNSQRISAAWSSCLSSIHSSFVCAWAILPGPNTTDGIPMREIREAISGVNLDEEAANLIRFEQAYNASAQVIAVARSIIDALFEAVS